MESVTLPDRQRRGTGPRRLPGRFGLPPCGRSRARESFIRDTGAIPLNTKYDMSVGRTSLSRRGARRKAARGRRLFGRGGALLGQGLALVALMSAAGCAPKLNAGEWQCPNDGGTTPAPAPTDAVAMPWSTGFENRFCDYTELAGNCYGDSEYTLTTEQVHLGRFAAKFVVEGGDAGKHQTRCIRRGVLPDAAYYGAWYYIPVAPTPPAKDVTVLWNLFHFQTPDQPNLWDVSLGPDSKGGWDLFIFDPYAGRLFPAPDPSPVPIGSWFHIEFFLKRAADATGSFALYQDDTLLVEAKNLKSDYSKYTEWYVGNLGDHLQPPDSTLYVDDVSIRATR